MNLFKHYSEKHNPNCTRLYWKSDKTRILDILYNKLDSGQLNKLMTICREKNNPNYSGWTDKPNRMPVMIRTSGVEFFATLSTLKKAYRRIYRLKDNFKVQYYRTCVWKKYRNSETEKKSYYKELMNKLYRVDYDEQLTNDFITEIEGVINYDN